MNFINKYLVSDHLSTRIISQTLTWIVSFAIYDLLLGLKWALVLVLGIGWHEFGHLLTAQRLHLKTWGIVMVPMLGGLSIIDPPTSYAKKYLVAMGGPTFGFVSAGICWAIYYFTHQANIGVVAVILAAINLFNLLPLTNILDGGQVVECIGYSINFNFGFWLTTGLFVVGVPVIWIFSPFIAIFLLIMGLPKIISSFQIKKMKNEFGKIELNIFGKVFALYRMEGLEIWLAGIGYLVLVGLLGGIIWMGRVKGLI